MTTISELEGLFDDHPSLDASLQDFEPGSSEFAASPRFGPPHMYPSHHSGFRSEPSDSEEEGESLARPESSGGYSPPAWRRTGKGRSSGFWNRNDNVLGVRGSGRESSPEYESADEGDATLAAAARVRLPTGSLSPEKRRSPSPDPYPTGGGDFGRMFGEVKKEEDKGVVPLATIPENPNNCK